MSGPPSEYESGNGPSSSHMMQNSRRGRPFLKDTFDLFGTLILSLELSTHKQFFRSFPNSFTSDEAATNLASLKFSQSNRGPDPRNPDRIITTTTTTTFSMTREMAKQIAQHFMDSRLVENAADKTNTTFKDRAIFQITPKGLHVLERFIAKNGMQADNMVQVFATQPICMKLLHLERRQTDDDIITSESVIFTTFRRFAGRTPNYILTAPEVAIDPASEYYQRANGVPLQDIQERHSPMIGKSTIQTYRNTFTALTAMEWLCDFTTIVGRDEAAEMCSHFMRYKLINLISDKRRNQEDSIVFTSRGPPAPNAYAEATFRCSPKAIYQITDDGARAARWHTSVINGTAMPDMTGQDPTIAKKEAALRSAEQRQRELAASGNGPRDSSDSSGTAGASSATGGATATEVAFNTAANPNPMPQTIASISDSRVQRQGSVAERLRDHHHHHHHPSTPNGPGNANSNAAMTVQQQQQAANDRKSNTDRLRSILEEPALRHLFREFLRGNFCEENLSFWLDVQDFKRRFHTTSSAIANNAPSNQQPNNGGGGGGGGGGGQPGLSSQISSGALGGGAGGGAQSSPMRGPNGAILTPGQAAMAKHHESLVAMTFVIYNTYLAQGSACELNIDHALRNELFAYVNDVLVQHHAYQAAQQGGQGAGQGQGVGAGGAKQGQGPQGAGQGQGVTPKVLLKGRVEPDQASVFNATQLQMIIRIYERIQMHVFRLMATDSVPKFIKTQRFLALRNWVDDVDALDNEELQNYGPSLAPTHPPGLHPTLSNGNNGSSTSVGGTTLTSSSSSGATAAVGGGGAGQEQEEVGRAYLTVSQAANEKHQAKLKNARLVAKSANLSDASLA